jgi:hypothetical protein
MVDRYTKLMLTIIAGCLAVIAFHQIMPTPAKADSQMHVIVDSVASFALQFAGPLDVKVQP